LVISWEVTRHFFLGVIHVNACIVCRYYSRYSIFHSLMLCALTSKHVVHSNQILFYCC
jgi:hypothetical protein